MDVVCLHHIGKAPLQRLRQGWPVRLGQGPWTHNLHISIWGPWLRPFGARSDLVGSQLAWAVALSGNRPTNMNPRGRVINSYKFIQSARSARGGLATAIWATVGLYRVKLNIPTCGFLCSLTQSYIPIEDLRILISSLQSLVELELSSQSLMNCFYRLLYVSSIRSFLLRSPGSQAVQLMFPLAHLLLCIPLRGQVAIIGTVVGVQGVRPCISGCLGPSAWSPAFFRHGPSNAQSAHDSWRMVTRWL